MKKKYYLFIFLGLSILSCGEFEEKNPAPVENQQDDLKADEKINVDVDHTIFSIPSPVQIAMDLHDSEKGFSKALLHDISAAENYVTSFDKAIMLGIYGTDLAYCSVYENSTESLNYFGTMKKMADDLNASYALSESLIERLSKNLNNKDSLLTLASEAYVQIDEYLKENDNKDIAALVLAGGWIESMYFQSTELLADSSESNQLRLAQNKHTLEHFITLIEKVGSNDQFWELQSMLGDLSTLYKEIPTSYEYIPSVTDANSKTTNIMSKSSFETDYITMKEIANEFINLRNYYIK